MPIPDDQEATTLRRPVILGSVAAVALAAAAGGFLLNRDDTLLFDYAVDAPNIVLPPPVLERVLEDVGVPASELTYAHLAGVDTLDLSKVTRPELGLYRFAWLELFTGLEHLSLNLVYHWDEDDIVHSYPNDIVSHAPRSAKVGGLAKLTRLESLTLCFNAKQSLEPLAELPRLRELELIASVRLDLRPLESVASLRRLRIDSNIDNAFGDIDDRPLKKLRGLGDLKQLEALDLGGAPGPTLNGVAPLTGLRELVAPPWTTNLEPLRGLHNLQHLSLDRMSSGMTVEPYDLSALASLTSLTHLELPGGYDEGHELGSLDSLQSIKYNFATCDFTKLEGCDALTELYVDHCTIVNFEGVARLGSLRILKLEDAEVPNLAPLAKLTELRELNLYGLHGMEVEPLLGLSKLERATLWSVRPRLSVDDVERLQAAWPNCKLEH